MQRTELVAGYIIKSVAIEIQNFSSRCPLAFPFLMHVELLDQREFSEDPQSSNYDENEENSAAELGLLVCIF